MQSAFLPLVSLLLITSLAGAAQQEPCGLRTMTETTADPVIPPIARAAHEEGNVILLAVFKTTGEVDRVSVLSGPHFLQSVAASYVQGWRANPYPGPRTCPVVVHFALLQEHDRPRPYMVRLDPQHVEISLPAPLVQPQMAGSR